MILFKRLLFDSDGSHYAWSYMTTHETFDGKQAAHMFIISREAAQELEPKDKNPLMRSYVAAQLCKSRSYVRELVNGYNKDKAGCRQATEE